jgi:hypothetical protein
MLVNVIFFLLPFDTLMDRMADLITCEAMREVRTFWTLTPEAAVCFVTSEYPSMFLAKS